MCLTMLRGKALTNAGEGKTRKQDQLDPSQETTCRKREHLDRLGMVWKGSQTNRQLQNTQSQNGPQGMRRSCEMNLQKDFMEPSICAGPLAQKPTPESRRSAAPLTSWRRPSNPGTCRSSKVDLL